MFNLNICTHRGKVERTLDEGKPEGALVEGRAEETGDERMQKENVQSTIIINFFFLEKEVQQHQSEEL